MNEKSVTCRLLSLMDTNEGWGRNQGREVYQSLIAFVERNPTAAVIQISLADIKKMDMSFASETIVELARRYRGSRGICLIDAMNPDMVENIGAAAERKEQPLFVYGGEQPHIVGLQPSKGLVGALDFALTRPKTRATEFASAQDGVSIQNASMKFKQLWQQGFLLRREDVAESGGVEFSYHPIQ